MPLAKPREKETRSEFLDRCMGDDTMNSEYPDNKQRYAVCNTQWRNRKKTIDRSFYEMKVNQEIYNYIKNKKQVVATEFKTLCAKHEFNNIERSRLKQFIIDVGLGEEL